jgi:hypothetical protein
MLLQNFFQSLFVQARDLELLAIMNSSWVFITHIPKPLVCTTHLAKQHYGIRFMLKKSLCASVTFLLGTFAKGM